MVERFAGRLETVVTGCAATAYPGVIHERDGRPRGRRMTVDTRPGCYHVVRRLLCCLDHTRIGVTALAI